MTVKLGSLFDGSGGFPLAGALCGIEPVWASEVEPYPIAVTRSRFPNMRHLGDISKVHGGEIEPVDIITFGSPCQDLSVAGKRAGLKHEANGDEETTRSGLFMEAVRIIKEMRAATNGMYPTFALWENVPGAFSSNGGEDFRIVCEELIKIVEPGAVMPAVPKAGWAYADSYVGDGWSLAYRVFSAQHWGVPQRRRRIHLVLDLRGERAREILFEREGVRGYFAQSGETRQGTSSDAERGSGADDREGAKQNFTDELILDDQGGQQITVRTDGISPTLRAEMNENAPCVMESAGFCPEQSAKTRGIGYEEEIAPTLRAGATPGVAYSIENHSQHTKYKGQLDVSPMLPAQLGTVGNNTPFVVEQTPFCKSARPKFKGDAPTYIPCKVTNTLNTFDVGEARANELIVESIPIHDQATRFSGKRGDKSDGKGNGLGVGQEGDPMNTLTSGDRHAVAYRQGGFADYVEGEVGTPKASGGDLGGGSENLICEKKNRYIVRRLTPTECARLQGFADQWGHIEPKEAFTDEEYRFWLEVRNTHAAINGKAVKDYTKPQMLTWYNKLHTDSAEYKMWGNGIALPPALYVMQGIADALSAALVRANLPECCTEKVVD
jgi:DNA (cytosine-5)-methyltransferase 1